MGPARRDFSVVRVGVGEGLEARGRIPSPPAAAFYPLKNDALREASLSGVYIPGAACAEFVFLLISL